MGVAKLKKAELYYHKSVREEIAEVLQDSGVCQVIGDPERAVRPSEVEARLSESEERLSDIRYLMRTLSGRYEDPTPSLDRLLGERPGGESSRGSEAEPGSGRGGECRQGGSPVGGTAVPREHSGRGAKRRGQGKGYRQRP